jgi:hypothetical protein
MLTIPVVETVGHVARHFHVLNLVAPHGHLVGVEHQDVGTHQHRVHEQAGGDVGIGVGAGSGVLVHAAL